MKAIYPGSFDPITNGHLDIIQRALFICDELHIVVSVNDSKTPLFSDEKRVQLIEKSVKDLIGSEKIKVRSFKGLTAELARQLGARYIIRGLRPLGDWEKEYQMAQANEALNPDVDTIFLPTHKDIISSSLVKEVWKHGGSVKDWVPNVVNQALLEKK